MKSLLSAIFLCIFTSYAHSAWPETKSPMPNFFDGFGELISYPESVYTTQYGDEVVLLQSSFVGKGLYISGSLNSEVVELVKGLIEFEKIEYALFNSNGGLVDSGLEIGRLLRKNKINTFLDYETSCASACIFAFIGGIERYRASADLLRDHPTVFLHTPFYLDDNKKHYLPKDSDLGKEVCDYVYEMLENKNAKRACFEIFAAKEGTVKAAYRFDKIGVFTDKISLFGIRFVENYAPPDASMFYQSCFLYEEDFKYEGGSCELRAKQCTSPIYSSEQIACMQASGYKAYTKEFALMAPTGSHIIRIQQRWKVFGKPTF
jgi:hypothetical protein